MMLMLALLIVTLIIILTMNMVRLSRKYNQLRLQIDGSSVEIEKKRKEFEALLLERTATIRKVNEDLQYEIQERMKSEELLKEEVKRLQSELESYKRASQQ